MHKVIFFLLCETWRVARIKYLICIAKCGIPLDKMKDPGNLT
jgi:hypothetical protein